MNVVELQPLERQGAPALLRIPELAEYLAISRSKAYQLVAADALPGIVRIGASVRVHRAILAAWLEAQAAGDSAAEGR